MDKRPSKEEFIALWKETVGENLTQKSINLGNKLGVHDRTIRRWRELYNNDIEELPEEEEKSFSEWMEDYHDDNPIPKCLEANFKLKNRSLIIWLSDTHFGAKSLNRKVLPELVEKIKDVDNVYILFGGDVIDYGPFSPKGLAQDQQLDYQKQIKVAKAFFKDIGHKTIAMVSGCHSHFTSNATGLTLEEELAKDTFGKIFLNDGGMLHLKVGKINYDIFMTHRTVSGSKQNPARAMLQINEMDMDFDCGLVAHNHCANVEVTVRRQKQVVVVNGGSPKGLDTYANHKGFVEQPCFIPAILIDDLKKTIIPFMDYRDALCFVKGQN